MEQVRQYADATQWTGREPIIVPLAAKLDDEERTQPPSRPGFNPTEAILATMQLLPLPCAKVGMMTANEIERNVSVIRSYAQGEQSDLQTALAVGSATTPLRRKSKSQIGLNDLQEDDGKPSAAAAAAAAGICDLDELRSFQRQLQNFPSLNELGRHPLRNWLTSTNNSCRRSLSPATSSRWLESSGQDVDSTVPASCVDPGTQQQQQLPARPSFSRSTSRSSSESRATHNIETYALAILQILQVRHENNSLVPSSCCYLPQSHAWARFQLSSSLTTKWLGDVIIHQLSPQSQKGQLPSSSPLWQTLLFSGERVKLKRRIQPPEYV